VFDQLAVIGFRLASEQGRGLAVVATINNMNILIATAAEEQSAVAKGINRNVVEISDAVTHAASSVRQASSASHSLENLSTQLDALVRKLRV
jgi:methyl-accepting chemotaxis protein